MIISAFLIHSMPFIVISFGSPGPAPTRYTMLRFIKIKPLIKYQGNPGQSPLKRGIQEVVFSWQCYNPLFSVHHSLHYTRRMQCVSTKTLHSAWTKRSVVISLLGLKVSIFNSFAIFFLSKIIRNKRESQLIIWGRKLVPSVSKMDLKRIWKHT